MIGRLAGRLVGRGADHAILDVGGVGYVVFCAEATLARLPAVGEACILHTDLVVREDLLQLFGFLTAEERDWHRLLTTVQGIGAKASLAILGTLGAAGVARAIGLGDWAALKAAPGIGPKIAQRAVNELKGKAPPASATAPGPPPVIEAAAVASPAVGSAQVEAASALRNLGYGAPEAAAAVARAAEAGAQDTAALIRDALRHLAPPEAS